jgi:hypothetical protein
MHGTVASGAGVTGAAQLLTVQVTDVRAEACDVMTLELRAVGGAQLPPFDPGAISTCICRTGFSGITP